MTLQETRQALIQYRVKQNISQKQVAEKIGCRQASISDFENRDAIGWSNMVEYADALGLSLDIQIRKKRL